MNRKQINIIIILALAIVVIFAGLGLLGIGNFGMAPQAQTTSAQAVLNELQQTGTVAALRIVDTTVGTGTPVENGDVVSVVYTGVLPDGTVFDSTQMEGGQPISFTVGAAQVIPGWDQGLLGMRAGGRRLLAIPPSLAYGAQGRGAIPPNATLIFDVQLVNVLPPGSVPATTVSASASTTAQ